MNQGSSIAPHIFLLASFLSVTWGIYMVYTIREYLRVRRTGDRRTMVREFRRMLVAICLWSFMFSFVFRTGAVLLGMGDETVGLVLFFTLTSLNIIGSLFAVLSLKFD